MMIAELPEKYDDYKNILNEYRDGILLFEVSNRNVWDKALRDTEGLEKYFQAHKDEYKWDKPHYKGPSYLLQDLPSLRKYKSS